MTFFFFFLCREFTVETEGKTFTLTKDMVTVKRFQKTLHGKCLFCSLINRCKRQIRMCFECGVDQLQGPGGVCSVEQEKPQMLFP